MTELIERDQIEEVLDALPLGVLAQDFDGNTILWNPAAERIFGWTAEEALGRYAPTVPPGSEGVCLSFRQAVLRGETVSGVRFEAATKDEGLIPVAISASPLHGADGELRGTVTVLADLRAQVRSDETLRRSEERLRHSQRIEALGRLAGGVAHDFNNLLTAISGFAELALSHLDDDHPAALEIAGLVGAAQRASGVTGQLLAFGRRQLLNPQSLDLNETVEDSLQLLRRLIEPGIEIHTTFADDVGRVTGDSGQLQQVIVNLALHARDAMPDGGTLRIETSRRDEQALLSVSDDGVGMDPATLERAVEPFFTTKGPGHGTGLGLATVHGIVTQSGGTLELHSEPGRGTTIEVTMPSSTEAAHDCAATVGRRAPARGAGRVLIVEDEDLVARIVARALTAAGYDVHVAADGEGALAVADEDFDLLLTDVVLPGATGPEIADRLRSRRPNLPVLFMSGHADRASAEAVARTGSLLRKPFSIAQLQEAVADALQPRAA